MLQYCYVLKRLFLIATVFFYCIVSCTDDTRANSAAQQIPERIISLAPSITETLFALGLGDRIEGVTSYCIYPPQAGKIAQVGSFMAPNFEAIVSLKPDLVVMVKEDLKVSTFSKRKGFRYLPIDNHDLEAIIESFRIIGDACGRQKEAQELIIETRAAIDSFSSLSGGDTKQLKPRVMLCVGRGGIGAGEISTIWLAGANTYYDDLIRAAGGINVVKDSSMAYLTFSSEGVIRLKPDIIIDVMTNMSQFSSDVLKKDWKKLTTVPAVKNDMIFCLSGDYVTIPGPRVVLLLKDISEIVGRFNDRVSN